jgi:hypothetical protein
MNIGDKTKIYLYTFTMSSSTSSSGPCLQAPKPLAQSHQAQHDVIVAAVHHPHLLLPTSSRPTALPFASRELASSGSTSCRHTSTGGDVGEAAVRLDLRQTALTQQWSSTVCVELGKKTSEFMHEECSTACSLSSKPVVKKRLGRRRCGR